MDKLPPHLKMNILSIIQRSQSLSNKHEKGEEGEKESVDKEEQNATCEPLPVFVDVKSVDLSKLFLFSKQDFVTLTQDGLLVKDRFLETYAAKTLPLTSTPSLCAFSLLEICQDYFGRGRMRKAGMQGSTKWQESSKRGDSHCWLHANDQDLPVPLREFIACIQQHLAELTAVTQLEFKETFEIQMARYDNKARYVRHRDAPPGGPPRKLTFLYYPNVAWRSGLGGELRGFLPSGPKDIQPIGDRLVVFWSSWLDHEVLPSFASRYALTIWAR